MRRTALRGMRRARRCPPPPSRRRVWTAAASRCDAVVRRDPRQLWPCGSVLGPGARCGRWRPDIRERSCRGSGHRETARFDARNDLPCGREQRGRRGRRRRGRRVRRNLCLAQIALSGIDDPAIRGCARGRRHLVLQPISRCALRCGERRLLLFVLRRAATAMVVEREVCDTGRDPAVPELGRRRTRPARRNHLQYPRHVGSPRRARHCTGR